MLFVGDNHSQFATYSYILFKMQHKGGQIGVDCSLQLGDMGIGFNDRDPKFSKDNLSWFPEIDLNHKFIRGNHDNPAMCKSHPNYLGDWGYLSDPNIFYVSGGYSVDYMYRTVGVSFWADEELNTEEMQKI